jgi:two-component system, LuxR family, sensor kinase FixL
MTNERTFETNTTMPIWYRLLMYQWQKSFGGWTVILMTVSTVLFVVYQVFQFGGEKQISLIADAMQAILSVAVVILSWRVTRHSSIDDRSRFAWRITTASFFFYSFGHILWFYLSSILGIEPFPSLADVGFWGFYPLMLWALLSFPTAKTSASNKLKFSMDVGIVLLGGTAAVWHFIIRPTIETSPEGAALMTALNLSYVVGDLVLLLGVATVLLRFPAQVNKIALFTIVFGLLNIAVADIGFAFFTLKGTYSSGHWIDNFFIFGLLIFLIACHFQYQSLSQTAVSVEIDENQFAAQKFSWLPYLAIAVVFGILLLEMRPYWTQWIGFIMFSSLIMTVLVVLRQITAVKENIHFHDEQIMRENQMRFSALVQHSSDLIAILDLKGYFTYQSPAFKTVLGYENDELIGRHSLELALEDDLPNIKSDFKSLLRDPKAIITREYHYKHKDGSWRILESITKTINDQANNISGILFNLRDVTERRETENQLRAFTVKLQQSNRELQDFAYIASHDLQEPLRKVQAFGDRLNRKYSEKLGDEGNDYINRMRDAADRMQTLINDLLTFSRVSTKTQPFVETDLNRIAHEVLSDLEIKIEEVGAKIEIADLPKIETDPTQMRQLFQNLIGNALKFNRAEASPLIKVYAVANTPDIHQTQTAEKFVTIAVEDNGIGFEEKYLDRIFTVFQRLHGRTQFEGSGVGLAVCRKIVERHNGTITAKSTLGEGATFIISLPFKQPQGGFLSE